MLVIRSAQLEAMNQGNRPNILACSSASTWIEVELTDADGNPVAGATYEIELADRSIRRGTLDNKGRVRYEGILPGQCMVHFPDYDSQDWTRL